MYFLQCTEETEVKTDAVNIISTTTKHEPKPIAMWTFSKEDMAEPNQYMITAELTLDKHWHIFDFEPGGDGLLIAPEFNFASKDVEILKKEMVGTLINTELSGIGNVRYYENKVSFKVLVRSKKKEIRGSVYYQLCDEENAWRQPKNLLILIIN